jgi:hypothetical protein
MASPQVERFKKLQEKGQWRYVFSTAAMVAVLITIIQYFGDEQISPRTVALYGFLGAVVAQIDWRIAKWRYDKQMMPPKL